MYGVYCIFMLFRVCQFLLAKVGALSYPMNIHCKMPMFDVSLWNSVGTFKLPVLYQPNYAIFFGIIGKCTFNYVVVGTTMAASPTVVPQNTARDHVPGCVDWFHPA